MSIADEPSMDLKGTIPSELALLSHLIFLDLSSSPNLVGSIPRSVSPHLQALYLEHTGITGSLPRELDRLTDLRISFSPGMQQQGLPSFLHHLSQLQFFEWRQQVEPRNKRVPMGGTIPKELGLLTQLKGLSLDTTLKLLHVVPVVPKRQHPSKTHGGCFCSCSMLICVAWKDSLPRCMRRTCCRRWSIRSLLAAIRLRRNI